MPHYPILSRIWWPNLAKAIKGEFTPQQAMDAIAYKQDELMSNMKLASYSPDLNERREREYWLSKPGAPKAERPRAVPATMPYDELLKRWQQ